MLIPLHAHLKKRLKNTHKEVLRLLMANFAGLLHIYKSSDDLGLLASKTKGDNWTRRWSTRADRWYAKLALEEIIWGVPEQLQNTAPSRSPATYSRTMRIFSSGSCFLRVLRLIALTSALGVSVMSDSCILYWMYQKSPLEIKANWSHMFWRDT